MTGPAAVILNTSSSSATTPDALARILKENGIDAPVVATSHRADIIGLAKQLLLDGHKTLVAGGGDGTVNAVASVVVDSGAALGILPLGGLNHFARDLKLPLDLASAVRNLNTGVVRAVDVGEVDGRIFVNNSGLGLYPSLVTRREKWRRHGQPKWVAFFYAAIATFRRFPFLEVRVAARGQVIERRTPFVFVGNNEYRMEGIDLGTRESLTEGLLFLGIAPRRIGRWGLVRLGFRALFGKLRDERDFTVLCVPEVRIASRHKRLPVSLDGEVVLLETPLQYRSLPGALRVIAPEAS